eukprot:5280976-Pleurochrysis_carterae.AAC.1
MQTLHRCGGFPPMFDSHGRRRDSRRRTSSASNRPVPNGRAATGWRPTSASGARQRHCQNLRPNGHRGATTGKSIHVRIASIPRRAMAVRNGRQARARRHEHT